MTLTYGRVPRKPSVPSSSRRSRPKSKRPHNDLIDLRHRDVDFRNHLQGVSAVSCLTSAYRSDAENGRTRQTMTGHADRRGYRFLGILREVVGARGFEPPTPRSRTECSTRLSHAPTGDEVCYVSTRLAAREAASAGGDLTAASRSSGNASRFASAACAVRSGWSGVTDTYPARTAS